MGFASNFLLDSIGTCMTREAEWTPVLGGLRQVLHARPSEGQRWDVLQHVTPVSPTKPTVGH